MSTLQDRIAELMTSTGWKVGDIAELCGVTSSAVTQWKDGPTKTITLEPAIKIERASGFSALWIASGKGEKMAHKPMPEDSTEFAGKVRKLRRVPVVGTAKLGEDGFYDELSPIVGGGDGSMEIYTEDPDAYGLRVRGQSMFPAIRDGWYVVVAPNGTPAIGEYVLLKLTNGKRMVKELLIQRNASIEVMSVNGGERLSFDFTELESIQAVAAVVPPSKWQPV
ncbi:S24 family peptidase [Polaromonas sp.]|uniref:S24 family peptidase n=1 Tax=Polaromonas sp. TaxID=1869339 RepID=UPI00352B171C